MLSTGLFYKRVLERHRLLQDFREMHWLTVLVLFAVTVGYLFIGAAVFQVLESDNEQDTKTLSRETFNNFLTNATCIDTVQLERLIRTVIEAYDKGVLVTNQTETNDNWNLWNSFFFSATVVTTIGYGNISPSTRNGQIFCIFYAIIGIPLVGVFLAVIGQKLSTPVKKFKNQSKNRYVRVVKSVVIAIIGFAVLVLLPAIGFHRAEKWTIFEAIYYAVITLTTVGFGDYVVGQTKDSYKVWYRILTIVWIFVGLAWFAVVISDIGDYFTNTFKEREQTVRRRKSQEVDTIRSRKSSRKYGQQNNSFTSF